MRPFDSFRARLTLWYIAVLGGTLVLFTALLYASLSRALYRHHDAELAQAAARIQTLLEGQALDDLTLGSILAGSLADSALVMVRDPQGDLRYRSPILQRSEPNIGLHEALVHAATRGRSMPEFFTTSLERSGDVRFICVPAMTSPDGYVQVGRPLGDVAPTLRTFRNASLIVLPLVVLFTSYGGWMLAGRALAPVKEIDRTLQAIHATDLSQRVRVSPPDRELQQLVTTVNQTLQRLEHAFASVRQFASDASHQLQTPLAVMKASLELAARKQPAAIDGRLDQLLTTVDEMSITIAHLQALALADTDLASPRTGVVDFSATCQEAIEIVAALAEPAGITVDASITPGVMVWGHALGLKQVVLNLGDNAVKYSTEGAHVHLSLTRVEQNVLLDVSDTGPGIDARHVPRLFERFYRGQRDGVQPGAGLGLAIVKRIVEVHGGEVGVTTAPGQGTSFHITLPMRAGLSRQLSCD